MHSYPAMAFPSLPFFNPLADVRLGRNRLPHWHQEGAVYFVTFRLADSVPVSLLKSHEEEKAIWTELHPKPWDTDVEREYHRRFSAPFDEWLDRGIGTCVLRESENARIVADSLHHFEDIRCLPLSWAIMPNHVHVLFVLHPEASLEKLVQSWKNWTARNINAITNRSGALWQRDSFDRLIRDARHFGNCVRYIRKNPLKANLHVGEFLLWEGAAARMIN